MNAGPQEAAEAVGEMEVVEVVEVVVDIPTTGDTPATGTAETGTRTASQDSQVRQDILDGAVAGSSGTTITAVPADVVEGQHANGLKMAGIGTTGRGTQKSTTKRNILLVVAAAPAEQEVTAVMAVTAATGLATGPEATENAMTRIVMTKHPGVDVVDVGTAVEMKKTAVMSRKAESQVPRSGIMTDILLAETVALEVVVEMVEMAAMVESGSASVL